MRRMTRCIIFASLMVFLTACAEMPEPKGMPVAALTFAHLERLELPVQTIEIEDQVQLSDDDVGYRLLTPPRAALNDYLRQRFYANGQGDGVRFTIQQASVSVRELEQPNPVVRWTGMANSDEYHFIMVLGVHNERGAGGVITLNRTLVVPQWKTVAEREEQQTAFVDQMMRDMDARVLAVLRQELQVY